MLRTENNLANGDLSRLTWLASAALTLFGAILLAVIAFAGWSANETAFDRERTLIENALNQSIERSLNEQKSVAWWDTSVANITDKAIDYNFVDNEFGVFLTETYSQDQIFILNTKDQPVYGFAHNQRLAPNQFEHFRAAVAPLISEVRTHQPSVFRHRPDMFGAGQGAGHPEMRTMGWAGHILSLDGRPAVIGALTIVPNVDLTMLTGTPMILVSITYIDEAFVAGIGRSLLLNDLKLTSAPTRGGDLVSEPLVADDGVAVGYLSWTTKHPGQVLLRVILPLVFIALLAAGAGFANMLFGLRRASQDLERSESQARHEALHDPLSSLPNRQHFLLRLETLLENRAQTPRQRILAAYIDVDRFKDINDTMGHHAGDTLIKAVAQRLQAQALPEDFLARFGGDEFAILRSTTHRNDGGDALARRLAQAFEAPFDIEGQIVRVTASVGIASAPEHGETAEELMQHADIALYEAKSQGRDCAILFASSMGEKIARRRLIEIELREAIENDSLDLHYQPLISARTGKISGAEALLRWTHPVYGPIAPAAFIPVAEEFGLMGALGDWVLRRALKAAKRWPDLEISINLSPVQFRHPHLPAHLSDLARQAGVPPSQIVLEITEGVLMESSKRTKETLESIRTMGFKLALDDFGTGYSSLAYLCQFKFDKIKIDRSFIAGFARGEVPRIVLTAVVALGNGLGMSIVAEGVETEFDALAMRHFGCTDMQGYFFSKAVDSQTLDTLLQTGIEDPLQAHAAL